MPASQSCVERTQIAARAAAEKFGTELVALDLSDQTVLSEVFLIITATNAKMIDSIADNVKNNFAWSEISRCAVKAQMNGFFWITQI